MLDARAGFREEELARAVADLVHGDARKLSFSPTPTGKYNASWYVDGWDRPLVVRVAPPDDPALHLFYEFRMMRQEPAIHALVRDRTHAPVAPVLGHAVRHPAIGRDLIVMERLPGTSMAEAALTSAQADRVLFECGRALGEVHAITGESYGYVGPHHPMKPQRDWPSAFAIMWGKLIADLERCEGYSPEDGARMRQLLDRHAKVFRRPVQACLLHMDIWSENLLCDGESRLTGILDWDRGLWGDPEIEFAVLDYCGISEPSFWEGYGKPRDESPDARVRGVFYLLYELQKYVFIRRVRNANPSGAARYRTQSMAIASRLE